MDDTEFIHQSIHQEYQQALADAHWKLSVANAQSKAKDRVIAGLRAELEAFRLAE